MNESSTPTQTTPAKHTTYQNNPFFVATDGLDRLFKRAMPIGVVLAVLSLAMLLTSLPGSFSPPQSSAPAMNETTMNQRNQTTNNTAEASSNSSAQPAPSIDEFNQIPPMVIVTVAAIVLAVLLVLGLVGLIIKGISDYTAAHISRGEDVGLGQAFRGVFGSFWGYLWLQVIISVKLFLWTLLFIIPGLIMAVRYSLAGVSFFDEKGRGNAAIKDSLALTKGAWLTTFSSHTLFNLITLGTIPMLLEPGTNSVLYGQYRQLTDGGETKPSPHPLAWVTLVLLLLVVLLFVAIIAFAIWAVVNYAGTTAP